MVGEKLQYASESTCGGVSSCHKENTGNICNQYTDVEERSSSYTLSEQRLLPLEVYPLQKQPCLPLLPSDIR